MATKDKNRPKIAVLVDLDTFSQAYANLKAEFALSCPYVKHPTNTELINFLLENYIVKKHIPKGEFKKCPISK